MKVGAVDIGTNSMRLLVASVEGEDVQWQDRRTTVTGLGVGVDATGRLGEDVPTYRTSVEIGSVRLTDRVLKERPAPFEQLAAAEDLTAELFSHVSLPATPGHVIGVAGTFTSLSAISQDLPAYDPGRVHQSTLSVSRIAELVLYLSLLSVEETAAIPSLDPARAPVILAGGVIAQEAVRRCGAAGVTVSEHDSLDGIALRLAHGGGV